MSDITVKIDGQEVAVPRGTTLIEAARRLGIHIPTFCYHDGLSIAANCRMCLVETNKSPKLLPACHATVMDGMEVRTDNERVREAHRAILEFILVNHPVDCPICDQAGECELQDNYRDHDLGASRLSTRKLHKPKVKRLGPHVVYDGERCILCTRCVRFCHEVSASHDLTVIHRGEHSEITTFPGQELDDPYSLCTVDLCPVGALTSVPFRFKARVWWLAQTASVCDQCARGCNIWIDTHRNVIQRYRPRESQAVNRWWMCDRGRLSFREPMENRLARARVRGDGGQSDAHETSTREAAEHAVARLSEARTAGASTGVLLSPNATCEGLLAGLRFARDGLRTDRIYLGGRSEEDVQDDLLIRADRNANRAGAEMIAAALGVTLGSPSELEAVLEAGALDVLVVEGGGHPFSEKALKAVGKCRLVVALSPHDSPIVRQAHVALPAAMFWEQDGTFVNFEGRLQRVRQAVRPPKNTHPDWMLFARLARGLDLALPSASADDAFSALVAAVPAFAGLGPDGWNGGGLLSAAAPQGDEAGEGAPSSEDGSPDGV